MCPKRPRKVPGGSWRVPGGALEGSGSSPEEILGSKKARKQREEEHNKEQKNNYIYKE